MAARVALALLLVLSALAVPAVADADAAGPAAGDGTLATTTEPGHASPGIPASTGSGDTILITKEYRLTPDRPGRVDIQWTFEVPDSVAELTTNPPSGATNVRADGFERQDGEYVWTDDAATRTPTLTFTREVNVTGDARGPEGADGRFLFADAGEWALIRRQPSAGVGYRYYSSEPEPTVAYRNTTAGPGVIGGAMVFLGEHDLAERTAHGQRFRLVVPEAATLGPDREAVFDTVMQGSDDLRVGDRDGRVLMIVAPTTVPWGVRGLQTGDRDLYVLADEPVADPGNAWLHEYVHTRQAFQPAASARWFTEGSAEYYAGLLTLEQERITYDEFREYLRRGTSPRFADVVLADPGTWTGGADYFKGSLVAGDLDRRLRLATDGTATMNAVFRRANRQDGQVTAAALLDAVERAGGANLREAARQYIETDATPDAWSATAHTEAFGPTPPRFVHTFAGTSVRGPYRNRSVRGALVPGETLLADLQVTNVGGSDGAYEVIVSRDGDTLTTLSGTLDAGASATETVRTAFDAPGEYRLSTGDDEHLVTVVEPASPTVTDLRANRTTVAGAPVALTATVTNRADVPARGEVTIGGPNGDVATRQVTLDAGETADVTAVTRLTEAGEYRFAAGDRSTAVTVTAATPTDGPAPGSTGPGAGTPGFGVGAALLALLALLILGVVGALDRRQ